MRFLLSKQTVLQKLVFPEGIYYNKEKHSCRTPRVNSFFSLNPLFSSNTGGNKKNGSPILNRKSALVNPQGQESNFLIEDLQLLEKYYKGMDL